MFSYHDCFKNAFQHRCRSKYTEMERSSVWQAWYSLEMLKFVFNVFSKHQDCRTGGLSVSVYGGLILYILTCAALNVGKPHYDDVIMSAIASQITILTIVYSAVYLGANQSKHQSSASLAFVCGIHRRPVNSPHKWPVTRKMFPFDDVIMALLDMSFIKVNQNPRFYNFTENG